MQVHKTHIKQSRAPGRVDELMRIVGLDPCMAGRFPHEFSGGQRQRIGIARALACDPSLIICDEPICALDVSIQAQVINLLKELQRKFKDLTYIFIAHDLAVVKHVSDRIAVMYLGHIVETGPGGRGLRHARFIPTPRRCSRRCRCPTRWWRRPGSASSLTGEVPSPLNPPPGCPFHQRCSLAIPACSEALPETAER